MTLGRGEIQIEGVQRVFVQVGRLWSKSIRRLGLGVLMESRLLQVGGGGGLGGGGGGGGGVVLGGWGGGGGGGGGGW